jgi:hypothetical protein
MIVDPDFRVFPSLPHNFLLHQELMPDGTLKKYIAILTKKREFFKRGEPAFKERAPNTLNELQ